VRCSRRRYEGHGSRYVPPYLLGGRECTVKGHAVPANREGAHCRCAASSGATVISRQSAATDGTARSAGPTLRTRTCRRHQPATGGQYRHQYAPDRTPRSQRQSNGIGCSRSSSVVNELGIDITLPSSKMIAAGDIITRGQVMCSQQGNTDHYRGRNTNHQSLKMPPPDTPLHVTTTSTGTACGHSSPE